MWLVLLEKTETITGSLALRSQPDHCLFSNIKSINILHIAMSAQATLKPLNIEQTLEQILASGEITKSEHRWLILLCFEESLNHQQEHLVNQVSVALRNGLLVLVDDKNTNSNWRVERDCPNAPPNHMLLSRQEHPAFFLSTSWVGNIVLPLQFIFLPINTENWYSGASHCAVLVHCSCYGLFSRRYGKN